MIDQFDPELISEQRAGSILVVDDVDGNRKMLRTLLSLTGYDVVEAVNGQEALATIASQPPDLVLLDILMPVMDGYEACRRIREDERTRFLPVVMITASGDQEKVRALEAGA